MKALCRLLANTSAMLGRMSSPMLARRSMSRLENLFCLFALDYWIARNPLKSPESEEEIPRNSSPFSWSGLDRLWFGLEEFGPRRDGVGRSLLARLSTRVDKARRRGRSEIRLGTSKLRVVFTSHKFAKKHGVKLGTIHGVVILAYRSLAMWLLGYPEAARRDAYDALQNAREIGQAAT